MHGNTQLTGDGTKTRHFDDILFELEQSFAIHRRCGSSLGGIHIELTGENVTECLGGARNLKDTDLKRAYRSQLIRGQLRTGDGNGDATRAAHGSTRRAAARRSKSRAVTSKPAMRPAPPRPTGAARLPQPVPAGVRPTGGALDLLLQLIRATREELFEWRWSSACYEAETMACFTSPATCFSLRASCRQRAGFAALESARVRALFEDSISAFNDSLRAVMQSLGGSQMTAEFFLRRIALAETLHASIRQAGYSRSPGLNATG